MRQTATDAPLSITPCDPANAAAALRLVFGDLCEPNREAMVQGLLAAGQVDNRGLLIGQRDGVIVGAIWAQIQPGRTAILWPPGRLDDDVGAADSRLIEAAVDYLESTGVTMAQTLLKSEKDVTKAGFRGAGFQELTELAYLEAAASRTAFPPQATLQFTSFKNGEESRLGRLIERTYVDSLDCPALDGKRDLHDVIFGYKATGEFDPARWFYVVHDGDDVGVLLLTSHPPARQWELVYMGIIPEARGRGWGHQMAAYALRQAAEGGAKKVVVAVDTQNGPAIDAYLHAGFSVWDRRIVLLRQFT